MRHFAELFTKLDQSNKTNEKLKALRTFFEIASDDDKLFALALFSGRRPKKPVNSTLMKEWAAEAAGIPLWLFYESYQHVGDLSETIALAITGNESGSDKSLKYWMTLLVEMSKLSDTEKKQKLISAWKELNVQERFIFNKLMSGNFRVGVSQLLVVRALSEAIGIEKGKIAHRLMGSWDPFSITLSELLSEETEDFSKPYPFCLAHPLEKDPQELGAPEEWVAEWKWDGIRAQIIKRNGEVFIWSRGEDLITDKFPELVAAVHNLPDGTILDGEILPFKDGQVLLFAVLQTRIGRKNLTPKILSDAAVVLKCYDLLEIDGEDIRQKPFSFRRQELERILNDLHSERILPSEQIAFSDWKEIAEVRINARSFMSEGLMLKRLESEYKVGRKKGDWWKWKLDPMTVDAVLVYAQRGSGKRASLYTDYTFAVRKGEELVTFAKAYSGLDDEEIRQVDRFIRANTLDKFGPVRTIKPELVFEIGFEGIQKSSRHRSGVAVRFPRILRWRKDKPVAEADTITQLQDLLNVYGSKE